MEEGRVKRGLNAIFSADAAGYSRLMGEDDAHNQLGRAFQYADRFDDANAQGELAMRLNPYPDYDYYL